MTQEQDQTLSGSLDVLGRCAEFTAQNIEFLRKLKALIEAGQVTTETIEELLESLNRSEQIINTELLPLVVRTNEETNRREMLEVIAMALNIGSRAG